MSKTKAKFNLFDVFIILAVVVVCYLGFKFLSDKSATTGNVPEVSYVVEIKRQDETYQNQVKKGDDIKDAIKGGYYGKVTDFRYEPCTEIIEAKDTGKFVKSEIPGKYNYYITITGTPTTYTDSKIMFASQEIRVGEEIFIRNKNYSGEGYVVDIDIND